MNLLCEAATVRPTVARAISEIENRRAKRHRDQYGGGSSICEHWECILGDLGRVTIHRSAISRGIYRSDDGHYITIKGKLLELTCAEVAAFNRAAYGHHVIKPFKPNLKPAKPHN